LISWAPKTPVNVTTNNFACRVKCIVHYSLFFFLLEAAREMKNGAQPLPTALCVPVVNSETSNTKCLMKNFGLHYIVVEDRPLASSIYHFLFISATFQHRPSSLTPQQNSLCCGQRLRCACHVSIEIHHAVGGYQELVPH